MGFDFGYVLDLHTTVRFDGQNFKTLVSTYEHFRKFACACCKIKDAGFFHAVDVKVLEEAGHSVRRIGGSMLVIRRGILKPFGRS